MIACPAPPPSAHPHRRLHPRRHAAHRRARRPPDLHQPRRTSDVVAEVALGDAGTFADACRDRARGPARVGEGAAAGARPRDRPGRPPDGGEQGGARPARDARRSASPTRRRSARSRRSSTPATSSSARGAACTARPSRPRCPTSSCSPSACRSAWRRSSPRATSRSPCRPGTWCRRSCAATRSSGSRRSTPPRPARRSCGSSTPAASPAACSTSCEADGEQTFAGLERALDAGHRRQGRLHRLLGRRGGDRRAVRAPPAVAVPRAGRQEPAGRHGRRRPRPRGRGRAVLRLRHRRAALHVAGHRDRARGRPRRLRARGWTSGCGPRRSAIPPRTSSTGRCCTSASASASSSWLELIAPHHERARLQRHRADHRLPAARGLRRRPGGRDLLPPDVRHRRDAPRTRSTRPRRSARWSAWPASRTSTRPSSSPTATATGSRRRSTPARPRTRCASASAAAPACSRSTTPPRAPRRTCPSAATASSGNGSRQSGIWVLDQFTRWQSMNWDYAGKLQKAQMDVLEIESDAGFRLED